MPDQPERRHDNVVNADEVSSREISHADKFGATATALGTPAGGQGLGCNLFEVPPGRTAFPRHYHCAIEEAVYVLSGTGQLRIGEGRVALRPGDWVTLPPGPDHAHQVINDGDEILRYLCVSTRAHADVVGYPDSNKILATASPSFDFFAKPWVRSIFDGDATVGYYDGEESGE